MSAILFVKKCDGVEFAMTKEEIMLRRVTNQYLAEPAPKLRVVQDLCGIQAQFMANALHSLKIRCTDYTEATVAEGLVKNWTVRGTVHVFAESDLPLFCIAITAKTIEKTSGMGIPFGIRGISGR